MKSRLEFGFYAVDGQGGNAMLPGAGRSVCSAAHRVPVHDVRRGSLPRHPHKIEHREGGCSAMTRPRPAEEGSESLPRYSGGRLDDADVWDDVDAGHLSSAVAALRRCIKMRGSTAAPSTSSEASSSADQSYEKCRAEAMAAAAVNSRLPLVARRAPVRNAEASMGDAPSQAAPAASE